MCFLKREFDFPRARLLLPSDLHNRLGRANRDCASVLFQVSGEKDAHGQHGQDSQCESEESIQATQKRMHLEMEFVAGLVRIYRIEHTEIDKRWNREKKKD